MLQEQGLGDDGVHAAGSHELGEGDDQLNRKEKQVAHPKERLPRDALQYKTARGRRLTI